MNEFDLYQTEPLGGLHFHMIGFVQTRFDIEAKGYSKIAVAY